MLNLTTTQAAIVALDNKTAKWAFYIYDKNGVEYIYTSGSLDSVTSSIILSNFSGINLQRNYAENTVISPSEVTFDISNSGNVLNFLDFKGGNVLIELWLSDGTQDIKVAGWRFRIKVAQPGYQNLKITAQDFLQDYLTGYYPNTRLPEDIFPSDRTYSSDGLCVPVPFGQAYVPLRDVFITSAGYIMLGDPAKTYTISAIRSPRSWGMKSEYFSGAYTFTQSTKADADGVNWRVFQAIIADINSDGVADSPGSWLIPGGSSLDTPVQFTRSDTVGLTNFADLIAFVLKDFGIPAAFIDEAVTFAAAKTIFTGWGLTCNGAFWYKQDRQTVLANLLNQCHACLRVGEKIELHVISKTSKKTITGAEVLRTSEQGEGSFSYQDIVNTDLSDSGYVAWQTVDEAQDEFIKTLVAVDAVANVVSADTLECAFVQDSENIKRIGILYYQRKYLKEAEAGFSGKGTCLALQPDDSITISADNYGGVYDVLIDSVQINKDLSIQFQCSKYSLPFQDWADLSVVPLVVPTDSTDTSWTPVVSGPDDGANTNVLPGRIRIGETNNYIVLDPIDPLRISLYYGGVEKIRQGNLNGFLGYTLNLYGIGIGDTDSYLKYDSVNGLRIKGAITLTSGDVPWGSVSGATKPADNATVGATWGSNLGSIPAILGAPSGDGLYLSSTYMGFYQSSAWKTYIDNAGNFSLGDIHGGNVGLDWNQSAGTLTIYGNIILQAGCSILWTAVSGSGKPANYADVTLAAINGGLSVTGGGITLSAGGAIKGGQTSYATGTGFFLGYESSVYKFSVGDGTNFLKWDGSVFSVSLLGSFKTATTGKRIELSVANNELYFYGDRGDGTIEQLVNIGLLSNGIDLYVGYFGGEDSRHVGVAGVSLGNIGVEGISTSGIGVYGVSGSWYGVYGQSTTGYAICGVGDSYFTANVSALSFTDRTPHYEGDALTEIIKITGKDGQIDHSTLPAFAQKKTTVQKKYTDENGKEKLTDEPADGRDIGAMVSILTVGMQQLIKKVETLENKK